MKLHPIPPGLWCVPSAIAAITGRDPESIIHPALNRHSYRSDTLTGLVTGATIAAALATLAELGFRARAYRGASPLKAEVRTWAARSLRLYPGRTLLLFTRTHALIVQDGRVYDNHYPHGPTGEQHSFARTRATNVYLVEGS